MDKEKWFDLIGYEGFYQMNYKDEVKSIERKIWNKGSNKFMTLKEKILKQGIGKYGHKNVVLSKNNIYENISIHVLKARQFIPNPLGLKYVDHIDGDPTNNTLNNLQWITNADNTTKGCYIDCNNKSEKAIKPVLQYTKQGEFVAEHRSISEAQRIFTPISKTSLISMHLNNPSKQKSAYGYIWKYKQ